ncbi:MAG: hypothetical protein WDM90_23720 [Ferruginibacter sp.]
MSLTLIVIVVGVLRQTIDGLVLASTRSLGKAAYFWTGRLYGFFITSAVKKYFGDYYAGTFKGMER